MPRLLFLLCFLVAATSEAAPSNDNFANAAIISSPEGVVANAATAGASAQFAEPMIGGKAAKNSVWYRFLSPHGAQITVQIADNIGIRMTLFQGYGNGSLESLTPLASTAGSNIGGTDTLASNLSPGIPTYLAVDSDSPGNFTLVYRESIQPNDFFADAMPLAGASGTIYGATDEAAMESGEPPVSSGDTHTIWYKWTAPSTASYTFDTIGSGTYTLLTLFTGASLSSLTQIGESGDAGTLPNHASRLTVSATAGTTYYIRIAGETPGYPPMVGIAAPGRIVLNYYLSSSAGFFNISSNGNFAYNSAGFFPFAVQRSLGSSGPATVQISTQTVAGGAQSGVDFTALNQTLNFADGEVQKNLELGLLVNPANTTNVNVILALSAPSAGTSLGFNPSIYLFISPEPAPTLRFMQTTIVQEGNHAQILITKDGNPALPASGTLNFRFPAGSIRETEGFLQNNFVSIGAYQTTTFVEIYVPDDGIFEGPEAVTMYIDQGSYQTSGELDILESDPVPGHAASYESAQINSAALGPYLFQATITPAGLVTGQLRTRTAPIRFKGAFTPGGILNLLIPRINGLGDLSIQLNLENQGQSIHAHLVGALGDISEDFHVPQIFYGSNAEAGTYTFYSSSVNIANTTVGSPFYGSITISPTGSVKALGKLVDGQTVSFGTQLEVGGGVHGIAVIHGGLEVVAATLFYGPSSGSEDFYGSFAWQKLPVSGDKFEPTGIQLTFGGLQAIRYTPPAAGQRVLAAWQASNGAATLTATGTGFNFTPPTAHFTVSTTNTAAFSSPPFPLTLFLNVKTGFFTGGFIPSSHSAVPFGGVLYQGTGMSSIGVGNFLTDGRPGAITLTGP